MTEHDQKVCLQCGQPSGQRCLCESCRSRIPAEGGDAVCSGGSAAQRVRLAEGEAVEGGSGEPAEGLTTVRSDPGLSETDPPAREVARFEEVLTAQEVDAELEAHRRADAAGEAEGATNHGILLEQRGDLQGALAAYRRGDRRGDVNGSFNLGCLLAEMGDLAGARAALERADARGDAGGASNVGVLLEREGDLEGALAAYRRADERGDAMGAFNLGLLLAGRGEFAGARAAFQRAGERGDADVREQAARAAAEIGAAEVEPGPAAEVEPGPAPEVDPGPAAEVEPGPAAEAVEPQSPPEPPVPVQTAGLPPSESAGPPARSPWVAVLVLVLVGLVTLVAVRRLRRRR